MRLALALGRRHLGQAWPNPSVGAVLVGGPAGAERILAQGVTQPGGRPHAERVALAAAGEAARGATLYVTLEPCSHHGRTSPCADATIAAGVARVVSAMDDPDPRVAGRGHARLSDAGIAVSVGLLGAEAARDQRGHVTRILHGRPAVFLKLARTADGFAAGGEGRLMISGPRANAEIHLQRAHCDAIMVGVGTVLADDPALTVRLPGMAERSPLRIVLDPCLRTPPTAGLVRTSATVPTLILAGPHGSAEAERALSAAGAEVQRVPVTAEGRIDLPEALRFLGALGLTRVCSEGGPTLADALARDNLIDECLLVTGDCVLGQPGLPAVGPNLAARLASAEFTVAEEVRVGTDLFTCHVRSP
ncbi:bifunctional diaminohydroxyphosphoribosylaminopyrimidine deaminase/5-amino-6-(5-phosphoribosylamino)uracil reductase RibD [Methylobacterium currus]|uniref:Riboflavin biosynthesis protein RibD n=1 Tax=Methylobacterium currus TaxID=2051553 RepID=A0A2R4WTM4_9HYPH|nr:bifunctional diaminohydroxyphosphoribosylaminopyrimidine deaminase/5-amino-6-(5-phosphoribosylamino)uracil reductase RibD [Methylobacterium currus]AWB24897.1 bifunctional diaminohydroxyphosphoribosylaminopyrimidine deaminase/5-amino-6-(5-phosphoribosylamino)uracil reductase RibD [Methylobacterium currus]UHC18991.1 bifunctional diaminohydroxyphosphoribosylaminopyrimidine deaminase/5-amino-6-(5-phosphoribosylamino)uracil reductase RibD [Methylobacterium currus]